MNGGWGMAGPHGTSFHTTPVPILYQYSTMKKADHRDSSICKNCGSAVEENYCPNCGQRAFANRRLKTGELIKDFFENLLNLDRGFLFTFYSVLIRPGKVAKEYISGKRKRYNSPPKYLIIIVAIYAFFVLLIDMETINISNFQQFRLGFLTTEQNNRFIEVIFTFLTKYPLQFNFTVALLYPLLMMLFYKGYRYNYAELLAAWLYFDSTELPIIISAGYLNYFLEIHFFDFLISILFFTYCFFSFYEKGAWWKRIFYALFFVVLSLVLQFAGILLISFFW